MDSHSDSARSKLDQILQDLAAKAEERAVEEEDTLKFSQTESDVMPPPTTPSKKTGRAPRKRKRKEASTEDYTENARPTYVLKLFDRSVDMAQFRKNSSMYVMCRAWTQNKPHVAYELGDKADRSTESQDFAEPDDPQFVYSLPGPVKDEPEEIVDAEMLSSPSKAVHLDGAINAVPNIASLKAENIARWQKVRSSVRDASLKQQKRYMASLLQLRALFTQP